MDKKRLWRTIRLNLYLNKGKRARYIRKKNIFAQFGKDSTYALRTIPLFPELISIGDNVRIAAGVTFVTHDMIHAMLNNRPENSQKEKFREYMGCIRIDNNVFVGTGVTILADVHIGENVIIGAGSLVNHDLPGGFVYAGVPAKPICTFEEFYEKRSRQEMYPEGLTRSGNSAGPELAEWMWNDFRRRKNITE